MRRAAKLLTAISVAVATLAFSGCTSYEGGKVVDGTNLEIGLAVPGTEGRLTINAIAYTGGLKVCGDERTVIVVTNDVAETNSYFGVVKMFRHSKMSSRIEPCYYCYLSETNTVTDVDKSKKKK